jgi:hypothetical protein
VKAEDDLPIATVQPRTDDQSEEALADALNQVHDSSHGTPVGSGPMDVDNADMQDAESDAGATAAPGVNYMPMGAASKEHPSENLVRARSSGPGAPCVMLRDATSPGDGQSGSLMFGYFSTFGELYEIDSMWEGTFLEQVQRGAFTQTIQEDLPGMRVLYDHGFDPQLGNKPLGPITVLREDAIGVYYEVPLLDTDYNRNFLLPCLRGSLIGGAQVGSQLGASFRFIVTGDIWDYSGKVTKANPKGLDIRTITSTQVLEFGPVTFPANMGATSGVRSTSDAFVSRLRHDPLALARFTERTSYKVVEGLLTSAPVIVDTSAADAAEAAEVEARTEAEATVEMRDAEAKAARIRDLKRKARASLAL